MPVFSQHHGALWMSTLLFGLQPGVSALIATRVRDVGEASQTLAMMRVVILANGVGAAAGGLLYPVLFAGGGDYSAVFLVGAIGFLLGAGCCSMPARQR